jgi:hypothetical protein
MYLRQDQSPYQTESLSQAGGRTFSRNIAQANSKEYDRYLKNLKRTIELKQGHPHFIDHQFTVGLTKMGKTGWAGNLVLDLSEFIEEKVYTFHIYGHAFELAYDLFYESDRAVFERFERGKWPPEQYTRASSIHSRLRDMGRKYLPGPAIILEEGNQLQALLDEKGNVLERDPKIPLKNPHDPSDLSNVMGYDKGDIYGMSRILANIPVAKLVILSASEETRDQADMERSDISQSADPQIKAQKLGLVFDATTKQEYERYTHTRVGTNKTRQQGDEALTRAFQYLVRERYIPARILEYFGYPNDFASRSFGELKEFFGLDPVDLSDPDAVEKRRKGRKKWQFFKDQLYTPHWIASLPEDTNSYRYYFFDNPPLPNSAPRKIYKTWFKERNLRVQLEQLMQDKSYGRRTQLVREWQEAGFPLPEGVVALATP